MESHWRIDPGIGYMDITPVSDGHIAVLAAGKKLCGLFLDEGRTAFEKELDAAVIDLAATREGPVTIHFDRGETMMTAFNWAGDVIWSMSPGQNMGSRSMRGFADRILALGVPHQQTKQVCRILAARTGQLITEHPNPGDTPDPVPRGFVSSVRSTDPSLAGLYLWDVIGQRQIRLLEQSHSVRAVAGEIAVIDTWDDGMQASTLIGVDTGTQQVLWSVPGGPNLTLGADSLHVAAVEGNAQGFRAVLRDLRSGRPVWRNEPISASYATVMLTPSAVLVFAESSQLHVFDRHSGNPAQTLDEPSTLVYGACLAGGLLVDICGSEVRCYRGAA